MNRQTKERVRRELAAEEQVRKALAAAIDEVVAEFERDGRPLHPEWIATAVMKRYPEPYSEFIHYLFRCSILNAVRQRLGIPEETEEPAEPEPTAEELRAQAEACLRHADELERYMKARAEEASR